MLIGISGLAGSGKDTCADMLVRRHGFAKVSFADPLKRICRDVFHFSKEQLWGPSASRNAKDLRYPRPMHSMSDGAGGEGIFRTCAACGGDGAEPCYLTPRFALQQLGTEWGRYCYPPVWVTYALHVAHKLDVEGGYFYSAESGLRHDWRPGESVWKTSVVIPDVRYKNEIDALRAQGAKLIRIVRSRAGLSGGAGRHTSETEQAEISDESFDSVIANDGTIEELGSAVEATLRSWW